MILSYNSLICSLKWNVGCRGFPILLHPGAFPFPTLYGSVFPSSLWNYYIQKVCQTECLSYCQFHTICKQKFFGFSEVKNY